jgi:hypothetical protein
VAQFPTGGGATVGSLVKFFSQSVVGETFGAHQKSGTVERLKSVGAEQRLASELKRILRMVNKASIEAAVMPFPPSFYDQANKKQLAAAC